MLYGVTDVSGKGCSLAVHCSSYKVLWTITWSLLFNYQSQGSGLLLCEFWDWGSVVDFDFDKIRNYIVLETLLIKTDVSIATYKQ